MYSSKSILNVAGVLCVAAGGLFDEYGTQADY